jgi:hypothetical protein
LRFLFVLLRRDDGAAPRPSVLLPYNDVLRRAGVLLASDMLEATAVRVGLQAGRDAAATDAPKAGETAAAYWLLEVRTQQEALEWAKRCPLAAGCAIEVRRVIEQASRP